MMGALGTQKLHACFALLAYVDDDSSALDSSSIKSKATLHSHVKDTHAYVTKDDIWIHFVPAF